MLVYSLSPTLFQLLKNLNFISCPFEGEQSKRRFKCHQESSNINSFELNLRVVKVDSFVRFDFPLERAGNSFLKFMVTSFYLASSHCLSARLQINRSVAVSRNAFTASHVMRRQKFYVKLMPFHRPNHSNGRSTIQPKHLKCRKVITGSIHHRLLLSPTLQSR